MASSKLLRSERRDAYLMLLPWIVGFLIFTAGPMVASFVMIFMNWSLLTPPTWAGLQNLQFLVHDYYVPLALGNTAYYTFLEVPLHVAIALAVALLLNARVPFMGIHRTIFYLPTVTPIVATALLWGYVFNPQFGLANAVLGWFGIEPLRWLNDPATSKLSFVIMGLWGFGSGMVIFLAGLQGIPESLYEAAGLDGAGRWARFWHVTLPMITPMVFFNLVLGIIGSFQIFSSAYVITNGQGGPADSTLFFVLYLFRNGFQFFRMGYASALAWLLFLVIMAFTLLQLWLSKRWVYYEVDRGGLG